MRPSLLTPAAPAAAASATAPTLRVLHPHPIQTINTPSDRRPADGDVPEVMKMYLRGHGAIKPWVFTLRILSSVSEVDGQTELRLALHIDDVEGYGPATQGGLDVGKVIASLDVHDWDRPGGWIYRVWVHEHYRQCYVGRLLLLRVITLARRLNKQGLSLGVLPTNHPALRLYRQLGFRAVGKLQDGSHLMALTF